jgi:transposase-like protein
LSGTVEADEVYVVAGHKGYPEIVRKLGRNGRRRRLKGKRGRGTLAKEKPPIFGLFQRNGDVAIQMLPNVQQATMQPIVTNTVKLGRLLYTDGYDIYNPVTDCGYAHKMVNHSQGEYARDADGDGFHEVHVNNLEGLWSWLRPHRGISQEKLPLDLGFFEFVHNIRHSGKALLLSLLALLLAP